MEGYDMWQLIKVEHTDWIPDESGYYTLINYIDDSTVRLDWMCKTDTYEHPIMSYQGKADDVRKHAVRFAKFHEMDISAEHAAYISAELARCELLRDKYVQD